MNVQGFFKGLCKAAADKTPELLMGISIASYLAAVFLTVKAVRKADERIIEAEDEKGEELTRAETVKAAIKPFGPVIGAFAIGTICAVGSNKVHRDRQAGLAAACALGQGVITKYEDKLEEKFGEEKADEIKKEVKEEVIKSPEAQQVISAMPRNPHCQGMHPFLDTLSNTGTYATPQMLVNAEVNLNRRLYTGLEAYITISDLYDELNEQGVYPKLRHTALSPMMGWTADTGGIQFDLDSDNLPMEQGRLEDGTPCYLISFKRHHEPVYIR